MSTGGESRARSEGQEGLAKLLRAWRERALLTQEQLADRAGVSVGTVQGLESGRIRRPRSGSLRLLADGLGLSAAERAALTATARGGSPATYGGGNAPPALDQHPTVQQQPAEPVGSDPPPEPQQPHPQIRSSDHASTRGVAPTEPPRQVPRQLPAPPQLFTGRAMELAELDKIHDASTVVITAIDGMAGVGKTALIVLAAHQMVDRYPDGQLFIDLHGYTNGVTPTEPGEALDRMLRALGVPGERIPPDLDERAALYRSRLADQRMLVVLDNAATETQVTPLLPGAPGCLVLVTSRRRLAGLDHTHALSLNTLAPVDAITLFQRSVSGSRLADQPPEVLGELAELCGRLPLAIRIAAARLSSHPAWDLPHLVQRLSDQQHRLTELAAGQRSVTAALDLSYQHLAADLQRAYRLLGLHPGPDIDEYAAAALLDTTPAETDQLLEQLLEAHLLQEPTLGRYRFHDLIRAHAATRDETEHDGHVAPDPLLAQCRHTTAMALDAAHPYEREHHPQVPPPHTAPLAVRAWRDRYAVHDLLGHDLLGHDAREVAIKKDPPQMRRAPLTRLYDYYRHAAALAVDVLFPAERRRRPTVPAPAHRAPEFGDRAAAMAWLDAELANLEAVSADAAGNGWPTHATDLAAILLRYLHLGAHHREALAIYEHALEAARLSDDTHGEATALTNLGIVHGSCGRLDQAAEWYERALPVFVRSGDLIGEARALFNIGVVKDRQGLDDAAIGYYQRSLETFRRAADRTGEAAALGGIGTLLCRQGRLAESVELSRQALAITRQVGDRLGEARQLNRLGETYAEQGDHVRSAQHHRLALAVAQDIADRSREGEAQYGLGMAYLRQGDAALAEEHQRKALSLCDEIGESYGRMLVLNGLGEALHALGRTREAVGYHAEALELAIAGGNRTEQDRARAGLTP